MGSSDMTPGVTPLNCKLALIAPAVSLLSLSAFADNEFSLLDVNLGTDLQEVNLLVQENCPNCMVYNGGGPAGIFEVTAYLRYQTIYFNNTRRTEVDRAKPFESVTFTFGPDKKVFAVQSTVYGSATTVQKFFDRMSGLYAGGLQEFTEQKRTLITTRADHSTNHSFVMYTPYLTGKKFQVSMWPEAPAGAGARASYIDFDALRKFEAAKPTEFYEMRRTYSIGVRKDGATAVDPRPVSSLEEKQVSDFDSISEDFVTRVAAGNDAIEVIPEVLNGEKSPPSQVLFNGKVVASGGLRTDGVTYSGIQPLDETRGLYRLQVGSYGNSCGAQQEQLLRVAGGEGYLSEPFGRCNGVVKKHNGTFYFSYEATEYEPELTLAIP